MTGLHEERAALRTLLQRNHGDAAWAALDRDGWFDAAADEAGEWPDAAVAALVVSEAAQSHPSLPVGSHLAAAAVIKSVGRLGVVTDTVVQDGVLSGYLWGDRSATVVAASPEGRLLTTRLERADSEPAPVLLFEQIGTSRVAVAIERWRPVDGDAADHEARLAFMLAAAAVGVAASATARTLAHVGRRTQFGKPLGGQQAVAHRLVDMRMSDLLGQALVERAAHAWAGRDQPQRASWLAKVHAGERAVWTVEQAIQLHGALGFSEEYGLGRALRVVQSARLLLGGPGRAAAAALPAATDELRPRDWSLAFDPT